MNPTSILAYQTLLINGTITTQEAKILEILDYPMTSRQIAEKSGIERSSVTARLNSLVEKRLISGQAKTICPKTRKMVSIYRVVA